MRRQSALEELIETVYAGCSLGYSGSIGHGSFSLESKHEAVRLSWPVKAPVSG